MTEQKTEQENHKKLWELIKDIRFCLMVTHEDSLMRARPMSFLNKELGEELWFFTRSDSGKSEEIRENHDVLLAFSAPDSQSYVSINGRATLVNDRKKIQELWSEPARVWFPEGPQDVRLQLIRVTLDSAEYWDSPSSTLVYLYGYAYARLTGKTPKVGEHARVKFPA